MEAYTASVALPSEATRRSRERAAAPKPLLGASRRCLNMPLVLDVEALLCVKNCLYICGFDYLCRPIALRGRDSHIE